MDKLTQRNLVKIKLKSIPDSEKIAKSEIICNKIIASGLIKQAESILLYMSLPFEVDLSNLIKFCLSENKNLYLPRVEGDNLAIVPYSDKFQLGVFGIKEPIGQAVDINIDLAILPVLAVDKNKNRLGKGKGYYDRWLSGHCVKTTVAVAFSEQVVDRVVTQPHDRSVDFVFYD